MKSKSRQSDSEAQEIPKEIWMMIDHLLRCAKKQVSFYYCHVMFKCSNWVVDFCMSPIELSSIATAAVKQESVAVSHVALVI